MGNYCSCCSARRSGDDLYEPLLDENEREAVADLLQFLENRSDSLLLEGDSLKALSTLSYSNNVDLQRSAALAFAEITERHVEEVDSSVLEPLLFLLRDSSDVEVQRAASAALGNLAVNVANKLKIVRLGGLEPLIRQMNSSHVEVQCNAVGCITNLATHEENKSAVARSGALIPLSRLARSTKDIRVQRNATGALLNMTHSEENRRELVDAGAIPVLVSLLRSPDVDVVYYCTTALSNLAVDAPTRKKLTHESRLIGELVELMESQSLKIQCQSVLALRNLASDEIYQLEICRNLRSLPRLLYLLQQQQQHQQQSSQHSGSLKGSNRNLVLASVACIRNISIHPQNEQKIIECGFLSSLVKLLSDHNEEIQCHAVSTIRNLAASGSSSVGGPDTSTSTPTTTSNIAAMTTDQGNKQKIIDSGACEQLQNIIESALDRASSQNNNNNNNNIPTPSWSVLTEMTACLAVLALSDRIKPRLLSNGIVGCLVRLTNASNPTEVQGNAAAAIGNLATRMPGSKEFVGYWTQILSYLSRFLSPPSTREYSDIDETASTFQHIAIWTILQFCESDDSLRDKIAKDSVFVKYINDLPKFNRDEEVLQLVNRVSALLTLKK